MTDSLQTADSKSPGPSNSDTPANATAESHDQHAALNKFIVEFVRTQPIESLRESYRVTPKGLFLKREALPATLESFQTWLGKQNQTNHKIPERKLIRRLFGVEEPELLYLLEGQNSLVGFLAACPIDNPQNLRVPYYLGSTSSAKDYLDPSDPIFAGLKGVRVTSVHGGLNIFVRCRDKELCLPSAALARFRSLATSSHQIEKHFPKYQESLAETALAAIGTLERAHLLKPNQEPLRPLRLEKTQRLSFYERWGMVFVTDAGNCVQFIYHLYGRNLHNFLRDEVSDNLGRQTKGKFEGMQLFRRDHQLLGVISFHGKNISLHGHALGSFIIAKLEDHAPSKFPRTVKYYLSEFILALSRAQPIAVNKIASQLKPQFRKGHSVLVNQRWLFVINNRGVVQECISRFREPSSKPVPVLKQP